MNYLSLFSGVEGGGLAFQHLMVPKWSCVGYVEIEPYCQAILAQRIKDGHLDPAPIFGDIRKFISEGYAKTYQGVVDVITAGFPCQPFSVAGKQKGEKDERNMWPETWKTIRIIRPQFAFLENVPNLLNCGYFSTILSNLYEIGYNAKWIHLSASNVGALHKRNRLWIIAYPMCSRLQENAENSYRRKWNEGIYRSEAFCNISRDLSIKWEDCERYCPNIRKGNGIPNFMDRIKAIGNSQVPQCTKIAWEILIEGIKEKK